MGAVTDDRSGEGMTPRARKERLAWPDLARGACMVLVVLLHSDHALRHIGENDEHLHLLNELLVPLCQPLFFLISGMLGAGILSRGVSGVLVHRVGRYAWLYILWWALARYIHTSLDPYGPFGMDDFFMTPASLGELFRTSHDDHWFFYALAVVFGLALLLSRCRTGCMRRSPCWSRCPACSSSAPAPATRCWIGSGTILSSPLVPDGRYCSGRGRHGSGNGPY